MVSLRLSLTPRRSVKKDSKNMVVAPTVTTDVIAYQSHPTKGHTSQPLPSTKPTASPRRPLTPLRACPNSPSQHTPTVTVHTTPPAPKATLGPTVLRSNLTPRTRGKETGHRRSQSTATVVEVVVKRDMAASPGPRTQADRLSATSATPLPRSTPMTSQLPTSIPARIAAISIPAATTTSRLPQLRISLPLDPPPSIASSTSTPNTPGSAFSPSYTRSPFPSSFPPLSSPDLGSAQWMPYGSNVSPGDEEESTACCVPSRLVNGLAEKNGRGGKVDEARQETISTGPLTLRVMQRM